MPPTQYNVLVGTNEICTADQFPETLNVVDLAVVVPAAACNSSAINNPLTDEVELEFTLDVVPLGVVNVDAVVVLAKILIT